MMSWFKKETYPQYADIIFKAFPSSLTSDVQAVLEILPFGENYIRRHGGEIHKVDNLIHSANYNVILENEVLTIPYRVYFNEPKSNKENKLSYSQKAILNCIYLRHYDGFLRQRRLEKLLNNTEYWITPFTLQLLGEYVYEIVEVLDKHVTGKNIENYCRFVTENPKYWQKTESRMSSYWNSYYRWPRFPKLKKYIGRQIANRIRLASHNKGLQAMADNF